MPGWTAKVNTVKVAKPSRPTTDRNRSGRKHRLVGRRDRAGPVPRVQRVGRAARRRERLVFKALQTYSDGSVVRWIELTPAGGPEPEHPAPVLTLTAAKSDAGSAAATVPKDVATSSDVDSAKTIGYIGIGIGAIGLIVAIVALVRRPKTVS